MNTSKSEKIVQEYMQRKIKYRRKVQKFSGTWETTVEKLFPLFCPAREADWLPGWNSRLIYSKSGYAEDKIVFKTEKSNPAGDGLWTFTGFKLNSYVEYIKYQQDVLTHAKITLNDNKDGTSTATWNMVYTALTEKGNEDIDKIPAESVMGNAHFNLLDDYLKKKETDTTRSEKLVQNYLLQKVKYKRNVQKYSGTWETSVEKLFPLFCPAREADWLPGWNSRLIYSNSGYAEDKIVFKTEKSNPAGDGLWTFTGFKLNSYVEYVKYQQDVLTHANITLTDNKDGTTTATWYMVYTALTEKGNKKVNKFHSEKTASFALSNMIEHYLIKGKTISKFSLIIKMIFQHITGK